MAQIGMFPLTEEEFKQMAKDLAAKLDELDTLQEDKDQTSREFNEKIKRVQGEIRHLAKAVQDEQVERQASDDEAPWQSSIDEAEAVIQGRTLRRAKRDRTGEYPEPEDAGGDAVGPEEG